MGKWREKSREEKHNSLPYYFRLPVCLYGKSSIDKTRNYMFSEYELFQYTNEICCNITTEGSGFIGIVTNPFFHKVLQRLKISTTVIFALLSQENSLKMS